jgi:hypothetical protein
LSFCRLSSNNPLGVPYPSIESNKSAEIESELAIDGLFPILKTQGMSRRKERVDIPVPRLHYSETKVRFGLL